MIKKVMVYLFAFLLVVSAALVLDAAPQMTRHMKYGLRMAERNLLSARILLKMKDDIGLDADQVAKIGKLQEMQKEVTIKRTADIKVLELKLNSLFKEKKVNRAKLEKQIREIAGLRTDMQIEHIDHLLDLKELLSGEQLIKIDQFKKEMRRRRTERREKYREERLKDRKKRTDRR
ncbi:MAG: hypothetical protein KAW12_04480 [Candidatus Aminicenantes bacterium]|nr:hypothetical protein [Candidatus Aminicenantes bacterium]